jgi:competence protein ComEA
MRRTTWNGLAACVAIVAFAASPAALAAKKKTPTPAAESSTASKDSESDKAEKVDLNTADEKTVAGAKGVGEKLAKELVKNRPYRTWEEVSKVKGVGEGKKLASLKKVLKLGSGPGAASAEKSPKALKAPVSYPAPVARATPAPATPADTKASKAVEKADKGVAAPAPKLAPGTKININTATKEQLDALPEIGPVKAQAIVDYRNANGKFASPEDVMKVPGIKEGTFAKIKDYVVVR